MEKFEIIVTTLFGLEEVLANELKELGAEDIEVLSRAVSIKGDTAMLYKCNLHLRTAVKVLKPISTFYANNEKQLYDKIMKIEFHRLSTY